MLFISLIIFSCSKSDLVLPDEEITNIVPKEPTIKIESETSTVPEKEALNPTNKTLLVKLLTGTIWYGSRLVDTTKYQYDSNGVVSKVMYTNKKNGNFSYGATEFTIDPNSIGSSVTPYVYGLIIHPSGTSSTSYYYCDANKRVNKLVITDIRTEYYVYDSKNRIKEKVEYWNSFHSDTTRYVYFSKSETGLENDYYSELKYQSRFDSEGKPLKSALSQKTDYYLSNTVVNSLKINYPFNFGNEQDYAIERFSVNDSNTIYNFDFNKEGGIEKREYVYNNLSFWTKYIYE